MTESAVAPLRIDVMDRVPDGAADLAAERGHFFHDPAWVTGMTRFFRYRIACLAARRGDRLEGFLPLAEVPALAGPRRLVSLPFSYAAGPVALDAATGDVLIEAAVRLASERRLGLLEIKRVEADGPPAAGMERRIRYATFRVPADTGADSVWRDGLDEGTRRGVRRSRTRGVTVRSRADAAGWQCMARMATRTFHAHGTPSPPEEFFTRCVAALQALGKADLLLAEGSSGEVLAGIVLWKSPRLWYYAYGASDPASLGDRPNHALLWRAVEESAAAGVPLDLGRAAPEQEGLTEFKRRWGGARVPLAYDYWPKARGLNVGARDRGALGRAASLWSRLPLPVARAGSFLYRYLG